MVNEKSEGAGSCDPIRLIQDLCTLIVKDLKNETQGD